MIPDIFFGIGQSILNIASITWWILIPIALAFIFWDFWLFYIYISYLKSLKWVLLEIKIPQGIEKTPKAMEQVFASTYGIYSYGLRFMQKFWEGRLLEDWMSFEIVGMAGGVHFYIRTIDVYRNIVESAVYSQYPDAEIHEADDYKSLLPATLPNDVYDIWGTDYHLVRDNAYPIRTYEYFESEKTPEEHRIDPIGSITEVMSNLKNDESLWIQIMVRPTDDKWKKEAEALRDKLLGRKKPVPKRFFGDIGVWIRNALWAPFEHPTWLGKEEKKEERLTMMLLTPGERDVIEKIEQKISKLGFEANMRFIYIDKKANFTRSNVAATMATFNQFNTLNLNGFRPNINTITIARGLFKKRKMYFRKRQLWESYKKMRWPRKRSVLNIEELATIYHFPSLVVEAPLLRRIPSKKGEPPAGLPVE